MEVMYTKDEKDFFVGLRKRVWNSLFWKNDYGSIESDPEPGDMSMPKQGPSLAYDGEIVHIALSCLDGALCDVSRSIRPSAP